MGQHAEDILEGVVCEFCGEFFDDIIGGADGPGYPRRCESCEPAHADPMNSLIGYASGGNPPRTEAQQAVRRAKNKRKRDRQKAKRTALSATTP